MGLFQKIFSNIVGKFITPSVTAANRLGRNPRSSAPPSQAPGESIDALKAKIDQETAASFESLKDKIAQGLGGLSGDIEDQWRREMDAEQQKRRREEESRPRPPWYQFINMGVPLLRSRDFESSNVQWIQYDIEGRSLYVEYIWGGLYRYWTINDREAVSIYSSASKGIWVWDNLRIRGTQLGHRKNYALVGTSYTGSGGVGENVAALQWTQSLESQEAHDAQVAAESGAAPGSVSVLRIGATGTNAPYNAIGQFELNTPIVNTVVAGQETRHKLFTGATEASPISSVSDDLVKGVIAHLKREQGEYLTPQEESAYRRIYKRNN